MRTHETVIHAGRLLATPGEAPKRGQSVWIADGKIKSVARASSIRRPAPGLSTSRTSSCCQG